MDFNYKKVPIIDFQTRTVVDHIYRPLIKTGIKKQVNGSITYVDYEALIDSGADDCIFPQELANIANIDLRKTAAKNFRGIGGGWLVGYKEQVILNLGGQDFVTEIYFSPKITGYGILGQRGFFEKFRIRFIYSKKRVEIVEER